MLLDDSRMNENRMYFGILILCYSLWFSWFTWICVKSLTADNEQRKNPLKAHLFQNAVQSSCTGAIIITKNQKNSKKFINNESACASAICAENGWCIANACSRKIISDLRFFNPVCHDGKFIRLCNSMKLITYFTLTSWRPLTNLFY